MRMLTLLLYVERTRLWNLSAISLLCNHYSIFLPGAALMVMVL